ncbi:hypothetical protein [uncultured Eudoraea sp.]|uniref:hypothetical protein n=1 Tax=uncultured Eudoraea sp. TaxID=1035614 RepID=UPI00260FF55F|nr:hypothetical protein [uncultured Eudoraea sp.]
MLTSIQTNVPKILVLALTILSCTAFYAQKEKNKAAPFVRVYNLNGEKISKGRITEITDSSLVVRRGEKTISIELRKIGLIKTKRSEGNNVLIGAAIGTGTGAILGLASGGENEFWGKGAGAGVFGLFFGAVGAGIGGITIIFKKSNTYPIMGDPTIWQAFKKAIREE